MSLAGMVHHNNTRKSRQSLSSRSNSGRKDSSSNGTNGRPSGGNTGSAGGRGSTEFQNVMKINMTSQTPVLKENFSAQKRANSFLSSADKNSIPPSDSNIEVG